MSSFSTEESIVNLLNYVTIRVDLDRHIPQKIHEFSSLALAGSLNTSIKFGGRAINREAGAYTGP